MTGGEHFDSDGLRIAYDDLAPTSGAGGGEPIVLIHGFASSRSNNWKETGWYDILRERGRRVIALDNRGHGESEKPHDSVAYPISNMADDVRRLMDHLDVDQADLFGYSMGGRISIDFLPRYPDRVNAAVLGGVGSSVTSALGNREPIAEALVTDDVDGIENPVARRFRLFAEETGADRQALAAVIRAHNTTPDRSHLSAVETPVLVVAGEDDDVVGDPAGLAAAFGDGESAEIPGTDHLTTVGDDQFEAAVTDFLDRRGL